MPPAIEDERLGEDQRRVERDLAGDVLEVPRR